MITTTTKKRCDVCHQRMLGLRKFADKEAILRLEMQEWTASDGGKSIRSMDLCGACLDKVLAVLGVGGSGATQAPSADTPEFLGRRLEWDATTRRWIFEADSLRVVAKENADGGWTAEAQTLALHAMRRIGSGYGATARLAVAECQADVMKVVQGLEQIVGPL